MADVRLAAHPEATQEWWEDQRGEYDLYVSTAVLAEAGEGDPVFAAKRLAVLDGIPELRVSDEVTALAAWLLSEQIIPVVAEVDAAHLAYSAVHGLDFLLTRNCKHIHNLKLERRIEAACRSLVFFPLVTKLRASSRCLAGKLCFVAGGGRSAWPVSGA